jgi:hypothetical protein
MSSPRVPATTFIHVHVRGDDSTIQLKSSPHTSGLDVGAVCQRPPELMAHSFSAPRHALWQTTGLQTTVAAKNLNWGV